MYIHIWALTATTATVAILALVSGCGRPASSPAPVPATQRSDTAPVASPGTTAVAAAVAGKAPAGTARGAAAVVATEDQIRDVGRWAPAPQQVQVNTEASVAAHLARVRAGDLTAVSTTARLPAFDAEAYRADPARYLEGIEPGRMWQVADEGPGIRALTTADGETAIALPLAQGASHILTVRGEPGWPVTFVSLDKGAFANGLTTQTVQADEGGLAQVGFTATPGTVAEVRVVAASPVTSGQVDLRILIPVDTAQSP